MRTEMNDGIQSIRLIDGYFTPQEVKEILLEVIRVKINFHNIKNWSSEERFGRPDIDSIRRVEELQEAREWILDYTKRANSENIVLRLQSMVSIDVAESVT